jgi:hypothetical protein
LIVVGIFIFLAIVGQSAAAAERRVSTGGWGPTGSAILFGALGAPRPRRAGWLWRGRRLAGDLRLAAGRLLRRRRHDSW